jgi:hypothetical protein
MTGWARTWRACDANAEPLDGVTMAWQQQPNAVCGQRESMHEGPYLKRCPTKYIGALLIERLKVLVE